MKKLAVIGKDVSKSLSPNIHKFIAEHTGNKLNYEKISIPENEFNGAIEKLFKEYDGFNVTIPYKLSIMPYLKEIAGDAELFGAVNTVRVSDMSGHNTDGLGFMLMLKNNGVEVNGKNILLLGAGGAGRSVAKKLTDNGAKVFVYDKRCESAKRLETEFSGVKAIESIDRKPYYAIINATGIGMYTTEGISPVGKDIIALCEVAVDLIYTPKKSTFLTIAENCGKRIINGEAMLFYQAYYSQCIYFEKPADEAEAKNLFLKFSEEVL
ncbi:MAG: shikimate dehydrogenase [Clostridia bacterium]|nr:shikimate dehydrogenase [Clostridia bacterium]